MTSWKRRKNYNGKNKNYSMSNKLKKERRSNDEFEIMLSNLTLEEVVALKLELSTKPVSGRLYGIPIWNSRLRILNWKFPNGNSKLGTD